MGSCRRGRLGIIEQTNSDALSVRVTSVAMLGTCTWNRQNRPDHLSTSVQEKHSEWI
jgi:hypothetical protein